jgi:hypothetical protein
VDHALRVFSDSLHEKLDLWFAEKKTLRDLVEITAASLLGPQFRREFEHNVATLEQILVPPREDSGDTPDGDGPMLDLGRRRFTDADLLCQRTEVAHRSVEQVIDFREDGLRSATLMRLWEAQNSTFWDAIHTWVAGMVSEQLSPEVAYALSVIARCSSLEVEATYLVPWASGAFGLDAQATVVLTLWHMSEDDATAPVALQIAVAWTNGRSMGERQCAMIAFSGDLGVRFPGEAVRRLWQGISQSPSVREEASISLSTLFTRLVEHKREASIVLKLIHTQLSRRQSSAVRFREVRTATLDVAYKLVSATLPNNRLACFELLHDDKSSVSMVAEIFGFLVQNRPARRSTLIQLRQGLLDLAAMGEAAVELARAFGTALLSAVDATGAAALKREFLTIDRLERRGTDSSSAETISACFESFVVGEIADGSILQ